jgi:hypothetical protein
MTSAAYIANGKEAAKAYNQPFIQAFPNLRFDILHTVANDDTVVYMWSGSGRAYA